MIGSYRLDSPNVHLIGNNMLGKSNMQLLQSGR